MRKSRLSENLKNESPKETRELSDALKDEFSSVMRVLCHHFLDSDVNKENSRAKLIFGSSFSKDYFDQSPFTQLLGIRYENLEHQKFEVLLVARKCGQDISTGVGKRGAFQAEVRGRLPSQPSLLQQFCDWLAQLVSRHHQPTASL